MNKKSVEERPIFKFALREDLVGMKKFLPTKGEPNATGWDVRAAWDNHLDRVIFPGEYVMIPL